jgi:AbrB family looped-hinge helix DNA binding protein
MKPTEIMAAKYLREQFGSTVKIIFSSRSSPDFKVPEEKKGFEVKRLYGNGFWMHNNQLQKMKTLPLDIAIIVFKDRQSEPIATIPIKEINAPITKCKGFTVRLTGITYDTTACMIGSSIRMTVPKEVVKCLGIKEGDKLIIEVPDDKTFIVKKEV